MSALIDQERTRPALIAGIVVALSLMTLAIYWQTGEFGLTGFDDNIYLRDNAQVQAGLTVDGLKWALTTSHDTNRVPLTWLSHMLDVELFGTNYGKHHFTSVFLHIANTLLLFVLLLVGTRTLWSSAFVAALFAVHPMHVESVAWLAERKDVLSMFFGLLAMITYVEHTRTRSTTMYVLTALFLALGLMAKPMLVTLPFLLILMDFWPLQRSTFNRDAINRIWPLFREKMPLFLMIIAASIATYAAQSGGGAVSSLERIPLDLRVENALIAYITYLFKMFWPFDLSVHYPFSAETLSLGKTGLAALLLAAVTAATIAYARRLPYLAVGWFWFLGSLVPVIGLVHLGEQAMADRYTYLPYIGLFVMLTWGSSELMHGRRYARQVLSVAGIAVVCILVSLAWVQTSHWRNGITLFTHALDVNPGNTLAHYNLANTLSEHGRITEAIRHYQAVLRQRPGHLQTSLNLGNIYFGDGKIDEAIDQYRIALQAKVTPTDEAAIADAHNNLGFALFTQGDLTAARQHYEKALSLIPGHLEATRNLRELTLAAEGNHER